jgi:type I restriction enzyme S subunit
MKKIALNGRYTAYPEYKDSGVEWLGVIPIDWELWKLNHAYDEIGSGTTPPSGSDEWYGGDVPWITTGELREKEIVSTTKNVTLDTLRIFPTLRTYPKGSIAIAMYGATIGRLGIFGVEATTNQACCVLTKSDVVDNKYLYYWLQAFKRDIVNLASGGGQPNINQEVVASLKISSPNLSGQKTIANFLDHETAKIDILIDKQQQLIKLLKEKRQAVISHAVTKGLNPNTPMRDSGVPWLGEVPMHWDVSQLKYKVKSGTSITYGIVQAGPHIEDGIPYIKTSDMSGDALPLDGYSKTSKLIDDSYKRSKVYEGDLVIGIRASVGKCLPVPKEISGANLTQGTAKISPCEGLSRDFLLAYLSSSPVQTHLNTIAKGATFKEITLDMLRRVSVLVPSEEEQTEITKRV